MVELEKTRDINLVLYTGWSKQTDAAAVTVVKTSGKVVPFVFHDVHGLFLRTILETITSIVRSVPSGQLGSVNVVIRYYKDLNLQKVITKIIRIINAADTLNCPPATKRTYQQNSFKRTFKQRTTVPVLFTQMLDLHDALCEIKERSEKFEVVIERIKGDDHQKMTWDLIKD